MSDTASASPLPKRSLIQTLEIELIGDERLQCGETQFVFRLR